MKKYALAVILIFATSSFASFPDPQPSVPPPVQSSSTWLRAFSSPPGNYTKATSIVAGVQGGYFIAGVNYDGIRYDLLVARLDDNGEFGWQKGFNFGPGPANFNPALMIATQDGGALVSQDTNLLHVAENGSLDWSMTINFTTTTLLEVDDGYILAGSFESSPLSTARLIKVDKSVDANGLHNIVWAYDYTGLGVIPSRFTPVFLGLTPDRKKLLLATSVSRANNRSVPLVAQLSLDGRLEGDGNWIKTYDGNYYSDYRQSPKEGELADGEVTAFTITTGGEMLLVQSNSTHPSSIIITHLAPDGSPIWSRLLHAGTWGMTGMGIGDVKPTLAGDHFVLVGSTTEFGDLTKVTNMNALAVKIDGEGNLLWVHIFGSENYGPPLGPDDYGYGFAFTGDSGLLIAGLTGSFAQAPNSYPFSLLLIKTNINGMVYGIGNLFNRGIMQRPGKNVFALPVKITEKAPDSNATQQDVRTSISVENSQPDIQELNLHPLTIDSTQTGGPITVTVQDEGKTLVTNQDIFVDPDQDIDGDGLNQEWENLALELVKPRVELDEKEPWLDQAWKASILAQIEQYVPSEYREQFRTLLTDMVHKVLYFVRVSPYTSPQNPNAIELPDYILFNYAFAWSMDYGGGEHNTGLVLKSHRGDLEDIILAFRLISGRRLELEWVYTSAHGAENPHMGAWHVSDRTCNPGKVDNNFEGLMCDHIYFNENRVALWSSDGKHAMYPSSTVCESAVLLGVGGVGGWGEDCSWDTSSEPGYLRQDPRYKGHGQFLFDAYNIGEPDKPEHQLINDLDDPDSWQDLTDAQVQSLTDAFPGETIYKGNKALGGKFCGGIPAPPPSMDILPGQEWVYNQIMPVECSGSTVGGIVNYSNLSDRLTSKLGPTTYRVRIKTKGSKLAGTDAVVNLRLYSQDGFQILTSQLDGTFESGDIDIFHIGNPSSYIGEIEAIGLWRDDRGLAPDWYVEQVIIENKVTGKRWTFNVDFDIKNTNEYVFVPKELPPLYRIRINTGSKILAGTDGPVDLTLYAQDGRQRYVHLHGPFKLGTEKVIDIVRPSQYIGDIEHIGLENIANGLDPDWYVEKVEVTNTQTGQSLEFDVQRWLKVNQPHLFYPLGYGPPYRISITTASPVPGDATAHITLFSSDGRQIYQQLNGPFDIGLENVFDIRNSPDEYIGNIVRVGLQKDFTTPGWYVLKVVVTDRQTNQTTEFSTDEWLTDTQIHTYPP